MLRVRQCMIGETAWFRRLEGEYHYMGESHGAGDVVRLVFEEDGALVLVDYKTDKVDTEEELLERYRNQVSFYQTAVEKTLQLPVKEALLYSFYLEKVCVYK